MDSEIRKIVLRKNGISISEILMIQEDWNVNVKLFKIKFEEYL